MKRAAFAAFLAVFCVLNVRAATTTVAAGETLDLTQEIDNKTNSVILKAGATLNLRGEKLAAYLTVDGGEATVVAPQGAVRVWLEGGLRELNGGSLTAKVAGSEDAVPLVFGRTESAFAHWSMVDATEFSNVESVVLTNRLFVRNVPVKPTVAPGAWLGFDASNAVKEVVGPEVDIQNFTLAGWNFLYLREEAFPPDTTVTVKGGATFAFKPCSITANNEWSGFGATDVKLTQNDDTKQKPFASVTNVVLASDVNGRAKVMSVSVRELDYMGDITGDGDFEMNAGTLYAEHTNLRGNLDFTGSFTIAGNTDGVIAWATYPGSPSNAVYLTGSGNRLQLRGLKPVATNVSFASEIHTSRRGHILYVYGAPTFDVGTLYGPLTIAGQNMSYTGRIERLSSTGDAVLTGQAVTSLVDAEAGAKISTTVYGGTTELVLDLREFVGETVPPIDVVEDVHLTVLGGTGKVLKVSGKGSITAPDCAGFVPADAASGLSVDVPGGRQATVGVPEAMRAAVTNWAAKVVQWYDASKAETLSGYPKNSDGTTVCYTNGYPVIARWTDSRYDYVTGTNRVHLYNGRSFKSSSDVGYTGFEFGDRHDEVNPYVVKGGLNGLDYVSMGSYQKGIDVKWRKPSDKGGTVSEARRIMMVKDGTKGNVTGPNASCENCALAILVFGSAQGGGAAILGGIGGERETTLGKPFFKSGSWPMYVDGVETNGNSACPNGGWQILSLPMTGKTVNVLGWNTAYSNAGGQDYAEVIFFKTALTDAERRACERYLAKKWGLQASYHDAGTPAVECVANGTGELTVASDLALKGAFRGTLTVQQGKTLVLSDTLLPPGEEVVPSANRIIWYDPDYEGALVQKNLGTDDPRVNYMRPRTESGLGEDQKNVMSGLTGGADRRPWGNRSARGSGPERTWLDFGNCMAGDSDGNTLRFQNSYVNDTSNKKIENVKEFFMVLDTSRGGGTPIGVDVNCSTTQRNGGNAPKSGDSIWPSKNEGHLGKRADLTTRLDNRVVDGTSRGFSGCPEVLTVTFGNEGAWNPAFFGYYQPGQTAAGNQEIIGESIFYSTPLSDAERAKVTDYLAYKWFGKIGPGYNALGDMTLAGAGRVEVPSLADMPRLAADFAGTVATREHGLSFTLDPARNSTAATNAWTVCGLELSAGTRIAVDAVSPVTGGDFVLIANCVLPDGRLPELVLKNDANTSACFRKNGSCRAKLVLENGALMLRVPPAGATIFLR